MERIGEAELNAYLDGELDAEARVGIESWLAENPEEAARLGALAADRDALAGIGADILDEAIPERMQAVLKNASRIKPDSHWMRAAASVMLLVVGAVAGWIAHGTAVPAPSSETGFLRHAVSAHVVFTKERRHAVEAKATEKHLVRWLSRRVGRTLNPPSLKSAGYLLVGGRLVADDGAPAAQFMYQNKDKNRLTLYVRSARDAKDVSFKIATERGVSAFYWIEAPYAYALIGKTDRDNLVALGEIVHTHLQKP
ncbi:MAG: anti-sigma factor [Rhodospirillaceae bacterium]|jgi:anti-sigma factor RsiW|nr:anti-sigma factor [Rhodospirillaceae bacterium]